MNQEIPVRESTSPAQPTELLYITTEDCHFCEHGRSVLDELGVTRVSSKWTRTRPWPLPRGASHSRSCRC